MISVAPRMVEHWSQIRTVVILSSLPISLKTKMVAIEHSLAHPRLSGVFSAPEIEMKRRKCDLRGWRFNETSVLASVNFIDFCSGAILPIHQLFVD